MKDIERLAINVLLELLKLVGPALIRKTVDEWELARAPSNAAFETKFGSKP